MTVCSGGWRTSSKHASGANVIIPDLQVSTDVVEFGEVKCGECRIVSIQLYNYQAVHCEWFAVPTEHTKKPVTKQIVSLLCICVMVVIMKYQDAAYWSQRGVSLSQVDKHLPMHLRRKLRPEKPMPSTFETIPSTGTLQPFQRQNIQVKFMPTEQVEITYSYYLTWLISSVVPDEISQVK